MIIAFRFECQHIIVLFTITSPVVVTHYNRSLQPLSFSFIYSNTSAQQYEENVLQPVNILILLFLLARSSFPPTPTNPISG